MSLENKRIIVTAGCSGLGRAFTLFLLGQGAIVIPTTRETAKAEQFKQELEKEMQERCYPMALPFESEGDNRHFVAQVAKEHGTVYGLVNTAVCRSPVTDPLEASIGIWSEHYKVNVFLTVDLMLRVSKELIRENGSIVNISSFYSQNVPDNRIYDPDTIPATLLYASSKAALNYITQYLAVELAPQNIRVNAILPGGIRNPSIQSQRFYEAYTYRTPAKRMAAPHEFNDALAFLLSCENQFCTGQLIAVDGGWGLL